MPLDDRNGTVGVTLLLVHHGQADVWFIPFHLRFGHVVVLLLGHVLMTAQFSRQGINVIGIFILRIALVSFFTTIVGPIIFLLLESRVGLIKEEIGAESQTGHRVGNPHADPDIRIQLAGLSISFVSRINCIFAQIGIFWIGFFTGLLIGNHQVNVASKHPCFGIILGVRMHTGHVNIPFGLVPILVAIMGIGGIYSGFLGKNPGARPSDHQ